MDVSSWLANSSVSVRHDLVYADWPMSAIDLNRLARPVFLTKSP
jgi:hypothetical protein